MNNLLRDVAATRRRTDADRPSPAIPLLLLGLVVAGALVVAVIRAAPLRPTGTYGAEFVMVAGGPGDDPVRLGWWIFASLAAYLAALWIARSQGYRHGIWVDRLPLALGGLAALLVAAVIATGFLAPGDLLIRGNVPLLAIAVGIVVWAARERRPGLWVLAVILVPLTLLANLYNLENVAVRLGMPFFADADEVIGLGSVALVLLVASAIFALAHHRASRTASAGSER